MKVTLLLILLICISALSIAQTDKWESYLPNKYMYDCLVDGNYLYTISFTGLIKYDLTTDKYENYTKSNTSIQFNAATSIDKDNAGNVYFYTANSLVKFNGQNFSEYSFTNKPYLHGNAIVVDKFNIVWLASDLGLIKFNGADFEIIEPEVPSAYGHNINCIALDSSGNIWGSTNSYIVKYDGNEWTVFDEITQQNFYTLCLFIDKENVLWAGGLGGYYTYDGINWIYYNGNNSHLIEEDVEVITAKLYIKIWFITKSGGICL